MLFSQTAISDFAKATATFMYDVLDTGGLEFRLLQCAAISYEIAVIRISDADLEATLFEDNLKAHQISAYGKAFHEVADLEWLLKLRSVYFVLLCRMVHDVIFPEEHEDSHSTLASDDEQGMVRAVLSTAAAVASGDAVQNDLASLEHYLLADPSPDAKDATRTGLTQAWATAIQRSAEAELPGDTSAAAARTESQWNLVYQTHLMQLKSKNIADVRAVYSVECAAATTGLAKEEMCRRVSRVRVNNLKETERGELAKAHEQLTTQLAADIKHITHTEIDGDLKRAGVRALPKLIAGVASADVDMASQINVLSTCSNITEALQKKADVGVDQLLVSHESIATKPGSLSALLVTGLETDIKLFFRGVVTPTPAVGTLFPTSTIVFQDIGSMTTPRGTVQLSMVVPKDATSVHCWSGNRFVPAVLVKQSKEPKEPKESKESSDTKPKGKDKKEAKPASTQPPIPSAATRSTTTVSLQLVETIEQHHNVDIKVFALVGSLPAAPPEAAIADRVVALAGPALKRSLEGPDESVAKKLRTATAAVLATVVSKSR